MKAIQVSDRQQEELTWAAAHGGATGTAAYVNNRKTEDALLRKGLLTYEYTLTPGQKRHYDRYGYRLPVLTVAGWGIAAPNGRPADPNRYTKDQALYEAFDPSVSDAWRRSNNSDVEEWSSSE